MCTCGELFSRLITNGKLTTLGRDIWEHYAGELQKHLQDPGEKHVPAGVLEIATSEQHVADAPTSSPTFVGTPLREQITRKKPDMPKP